MKQFNVCPLVFVIYSNSQRFLPPFEPMLLHSFSTDPLDTWNMEHGTTFSKNWKTSPHHIRHATPRHATPRQKNQWTFILECFRGGGWAETLVSLFYPPLQFLIVISLNLELTSNLYPLSLFLHPIPLSLVIPCQWNMIELYLSKILAFTSPIHVQRRPPIIDSKEIWTFVN